MSIISAVVLVLAGGCTAYHMDGRERMPALPQHYSQFDLQMAWDVRQVDGSTIITGIVRNVRYYSMEELEIRVAALDATGRDAYHAVDFVSRLGDNESAPFTLKLPPLAPGSKLRFYYRYIGSDGGGDSGGADWWRQTFESTVP